MSAETMHLAENKDETASTPLLRPEPSRLLCKTLQPEPNRVQLASHWLDRPPTLSLFRVRDYRRLYLSAHFLFGLGWFSTYMAQWTLDEHEVVDKDRVD